ncbi:MAG: hypothetical protein KAQ83_02095, partial [Nanoarchaeota archaeon]|nr:hypothetical protein [Nanoarchaeota archaeon]
LIYLDTTTCKDTYKEFKNIFEYVLSDGAHTPYALLRSENKILGVLKFEGYSHILFFDRFVDRDNALFAYPGAVVNLAFEQNRYLYPDLGIIEYPPDLKESLKSESIIVIDMPSEFYLDFQKSIGRKGNPEDTDYFTNENIENKINQFQAKIQELMTQRKVEVYDGGGFLRTTD